MKLLALDIASKTGWAYGTDAADVRFGMYEAKRPGENLELGMLGFGIWLRAMIEKQGIDGVAIEKPIALQGVTSFQTLLILYGLFGVATFITMEVLHAPPLVVAAPTARKTVTGRGNAKKPEVIEFLRRAGYRVAEDNAADALVIYLHAIQQRAGARDEAQDSRPDPGEGALRP